MKANNNNSIYSSYKIINYPQMIVTVFPNNKSEYVVTNEKKVNRVRRFTVSLKSILTNLYVQILSFKDTSTSTTTPTTSTTAIAVAVAAENTTSTHATTITTITNNNNMIYFLKLRGISQGDPRRDSHCTVEIREENDERI